MDKDLFGNSVDSQKELTSIQRMATRQVVLPGRDLYTTEPMDIVRFIKAIKRDNLALAGPIWEPAAGRGDISKTLMCYGYEVYSTDLYAYKDDDIDIKELNFLSCTAPEKNCKTIFTNPPFNIQEDFLLKSLSFGTNVLFFVRLSFLSSIRRYKIYEKYKPSYVYIYSARAHCYKDGDISKGQNMIDYCIIVFQPPYKNETIVRWIE